MNDPYQAIYDATRSKIGSCDSERAVGDAVRQCFDISYVLSRAQDAIESIASRATDPHVLMRPRLFVDGNQWCALYGDDLMEGVAGFGSSPCEAMDNFDKAWWAKIPGGAS